MIMLLSVGIKIFVLYNQLIGGFYEKNSDITVVLIKSVGFYSVQRKNEGYDNNSSVKNEINLTTAEPAATSNLLLGEKNIMCLFMDFLIR